jgi:hypothetical protein
VWPQKYIEKKKITFYNIGPQILSDPGDPALPPLLVRGAAASAR